MTTRHLTIEEIIEAAEKNGFPWNNKESDLTPTNHCILEQVAENLGHSRNDWMRIADALSSLGKTPFKNEGEKYIGTAIWIYNDERAKSYEDALKFMKTILKPHRGKTVELRNL